MIRKTKGTPRHLVVIVSEGGGDESRRYWGRVLLGTHYSDKREPVHAEERNGRQVGEGPHHNHRRKSSSMVV